MRKSIPMLDKSKTPARRPRASSQTHRNEFPAGYSLASCSPAELASAFPTNVVLQQSRLSVEQTSADCSCLSSVLSQKGPQSTQNGFFRIPLPAGGRFAREEREHSENFRALRGIETQIAAVTRARSE